MGSLPGTFHQLAWVVDDLEAAVAHWTEVVGVPDFFRMNDLRCDEMGGTYKGQPGTWAISLALGFHGDLQIELIQPLQGPSAYHDFIDAGRSGPHHIGYRVDDAERVGTQLKAQGFEKVQTASIRGLVASYYDTTAVTGMYTELIELDEDGARFFRSLRGA